MKLREIAGLIGAELTGSPDVEIKGAAGISDAKRWRYNISLHY